MNLQFENDATAQVRARIMTGVLVGAAVITWVIAATLGWVVAPLLEAEPPVAQSPESLPPVALAVASAGSGLVLFVGLAINWFAPAHGIGRAILLVDGLMVAMAGALLANETVESGWVGSAAALGLAFGLVQLVIGLLAWIASLSDWLPGRSLFKHMRVTEAARLPGHVRRWLPLLTGALALGWVLCAVAVVTRFDMDRTGMVAWFVAVWGMPILAGVVVTGWRETEPNRLPTLGMAALTGLTLDLLYLLVLGLWYYRFNPIGFAPWWAIMGAIFGATGFGLWELLVRPRAKSAPSRLLGAPEAVQP